MDDRLRRWIYGIAGSSYVILFSSLLVIVIGASEGALHDPLLLKAIAVLMVYFVSLWLLHISKQRNPRGKLKLWLSSLVIHLLIMAYIVYVSGIEFALVVLIPEIAILILMVVGIISIWNTARTITIYRDRE